MMDPERVIELTDGGSADGVVGGFAVVVGGFAVDGGEVEG